MYLVIDKGNTLIKVYIFNGDKIVARAKFESLDLFLLDKIFKEYSIEASIYAHVGNADERSISFLNTHSKFINFNYLTPLPFINKYSSPDTLGLDRLASVCAAFQLMPNTPVLCIDMGTCITYDFINDKAEYLGGGISPGIQMRFKALNTFTAQLPLIQADARKPSLIGDSTENSIKSGVINGVVQEIIGTISSYEYQYPRLQVLMCGGDLAFFDTQVKNSIFARPDLVAEGLNTILQYNVQHK